MNRAKILLSAFLVLLLPTIGMGSYFNYLDEAIAGNHFGVGARQMAMGGAGIMSMDGSVLFYNPANLARIPRIEFNLGLSYQKYKDNTSTQTVGLSQQYDANDSKTNTRINSIIVTIPYPTYRGSLVFGIGMAHLINFDRVAKFYYQQDSAMYTNSLEEEAFESGGLNEYSFGFGIDLSPRLSFGAALLYYSGKDDFTLSSDLYKNGSYDPLKQLLAYKYSGVGIKAGLAMQVSQYLGVGVMIQSPTSLSVKQDEQLIENGTTYGYTEYDLKKPFVFSSGLIFRFNNLTILADMNYTDWSQMQYSDNSDMELTYNSDFKDYYKEVVNLKVGAEYVIPALGLSLRGGYFNDPLPFKDIEENGVKTYDAKKRDGFSFGLGFLVDEVMTIDVAYVYESYKSDYYRKAGSLVDFDLPMTLSEDVSRNRIYLTGAYRF
jgi:long-subunit fatty acid transport protein